MLTQIPALMRRLFPLVWSTHGERRRRVSQYVHYTTCITRFSHINQLLDDDTEVIGTLHQNSVLLEGELFPASKPGAGHEYLELNNIPADELVEVLGTYRLPAICTVCRQKLTYHLSGLPAYLHSTRADVLDYEVRLRTSVHSNPATPKKLAREVAQAS